MTSLAVQENYGALEEPATLTMKRQLPGPIDRVWAYLTESDLRRRWLAAGDMEMREGAAFELVWRNSELTDPPGAKPDGFGDEHRLDSEITELDPPRLLGFTWGSTGGVTMELEEVGDKVLLTVTHRRILDRSSQLNISAGWHAHLDMLAAQLAGEPLSQPFWDRWLGLKADYERRIPA
jgi:uncharacterized protein YndB with AHSA1/START domain